MPDPRFGFSTHLFQNERLTRDHLVHIAVHGFECVEVVAIRSHFDYHSEAAIGELAEWLSDTGLTLHSVHAPIAEAVRGRSPIGWYSNASGNDPRRQVALAETRAALSIARVIPFEFLVVHLGMPVTAQPVPGENQRDAARRSAETILDLAADAGVRVAFEVMGNPLSTADTLVRLLEETLDSDTASLCLDYGHGHLTGDLADVIETVGGHIGTTHLHDNDGRHDAHRMPYDGSIDWDAAMTETQKIGYDGVLLFEVSESGDPARILTRAAKARERLSRALITF